MKVREPKQRGKWIDRLMESMVYIAGGITLTVILAIAYYLAHESQYAFKRTFTYGYRVALQPTKGTFEKDVAQDPNATILTAHTEGADGPDEKEEGMSMPDLETLKGSSMVATGTALTGDLVTAQKSETLYRDDWRGAKTAEKGDKFLIFGFATPEYSEPKMVLAWTPDQGADSKLTPYEFHLKVVQAPEGQPLPNINIDLKNDRSGKVELPTYIAKTDADRTKGYIFEVSVVPSSSQTTATAAGFNRTEWGPTLAHPRYGFVALLASTLLMTAIALLFAAPIGVGAALYVSEVAPRRIREFLKPIIELLASVPTVVLGYFGLMILAPSLVKIVPEAAGMQSGRAMITAAVMMAVMLIPTIMTLAEDTLRSLPGTFRDGGEALGLTKQETIKRILMPAAKAGLSATMLFAFARAVGETMIVWILSGGTPKLPSAVRDIFGPTRGMADTIAVEMGNVAFEEQHYGHLFLLGMALFAITLVINLIAFRLRRNAWQH